MGSPPAAPVAAFPEALWGDREPRRWQSEALVAAADALVAGRWGVISAVMGAGKSVLIFGLVRWWLSDPRRAALGPVVVTTPTVRLVDQLAETLGAGLSVGKFYTHAKEADAPVVVCCNASARRLAETLGQRVGLWVADEAHRTESEGLLEAAEVLNPHARVAVTATPFRSNEKERITAFNETLYRYTPADAIRDPNVIVPWRIVGWQGREVDVDDACISLIREHGRGPGIVNASTIADAEAFAARLTREGLRAEAVHSQLPRGESERRIAALKVGQLAAVVHVSLLVEGVDYPWLRWACLRRMTAARVRFVQEVGRVLRWHPGKAEAVLLDPNNLFDDHMLTAEDALGWREPEAETGGTPGEARSDEEAEERNVEPKVRRVRARNAVAVWARELVLALSAEWVERIKATSSAWRAQPPSPAQLAYLARLVHDAGALLPSNHEAAARAVIASGVILTSGVTSDLIGVLKALHARKRPWVPAVQITAPSLAAIAAASVELPEDLTWEYAGVLTKTNIAAIVVLRGNVVIERFARPKRPDETFWKVESEAAALARRHAPPGATITKGETAKRMAFAAANGHFYRSRS